MNEIHMVRELLEEPPPPSRQVFAQALGRLEAEAASKGRTPRRVAFGLGAGLVAATAVVGVVALGVGGSPGSSGAGPQARPTELPARTILLAAADQAAKEPIGRYWRLRTTRGVAYRVGKGGYTVLGARHELDGWRARSDKDGDVLYGRELGARPLTGEDAAAWRRAGSPSSFRVWSNDHWITYGTRTGPWDVDRTSPTSKQRMAAQAREMCANPTRPELRAKCLMVQLSWEDREKLAADPERFQRLLVPSGPNRGPDGPTLMLMNGYDFLTMQPASPKVRATVFRLLAGQSGIRSIGRVTDAQGRVGIGLAARGTDQNGGQVVDYQLVLDPKTYRILGEQEVLVRPGTGPYRAMKKGALLSQEIVHFAGWSNDPPRRG